MQARSFGMHFEPRALPGASAMRRCALGAG